MGSPVLANDFLVSSFSGDACDRITKLLEIHEKLRTWFDWAFDDEGNATTDFLALFASISMARGAIVWYPRNSVPSGYLIANGAAVSRVTYAELFNVYGTEFGAGDGSTTFNLPDLQGKFLLGADGVRPVSTTGGEAEHTLVTAEIPAHAHSLKLQLDGIGGAGNNFATWEQSTTPNTSSTTNTESAGGGAAHNNMPPFRSGLWLVKT